ncbi:MAG: DUF4114 domain-containing protein [Geminicoccaceae bacterium]|nr:DUF4114 domain-containing protein [Geminicoccaceae bacterium]
MLPNLNEKTALDSSLVNGVSSADLTASAGQKISISFVEEDAGYLNSLGYYEIGSDGTIGPAKMVFESLDGEDRGGGPLTAGDSVDLGTFASGTTIGLFMIQDGANLGVDLSTGSLAFEDGSGGSANTGDSSPPVLYHIADDGTRTEITAPVFHTNAGLNADGTQHAVSAADSDGSTLVAFEDLAATARNYDGDFNDAVIDVTIEDDSTVTPPTPDDTTQTVDSTPVTLPDGQEVAVQITTESSTSDDTAELSGSLSLSGFLASNFNIAYVIDVSGSTGSYAVDDQYNILDLDNDGSSDTVLDAEKLAFIELNQQLIDNGLSGSDLAVIPFATSSRILSDTKLGGDADSDGIFDAVSAINSLSDGGGTSFYSPLVRAAEYFENQPDVDTATNVVFFASDGYASTSSSSVVNAINHLQDPNGINALVNVFGVGSGTDQTALDAMDNTGGAEIITDLSQLSAGLSSSSINISDIVSVDISVNGVVQTTLDSSAFTDSPTGPKFGPVTLTGLDPNAINDVDIDAVLTTDSGDQFDLAISTQIAGSGAASSTASTEPMVQSLTDSGDFYVIA